MLRGEAAQAPLPVRLCSHTPALLSLSLGCSEKEQDHGPGVDVPWCPSSSAPAQKNPCQAVQKTQTSIYNFLTAWIAQSFKSPVKSVLPPFSPHNKTRGGSLG